MIKSNATKKPVAAAAKTTAVKAATSKATPATAPKPVAKKTPAKPAAKDVAPVVASVAKPAKVAAKSKSAAKPAAKTPSKSATKLPKPAAKAGAKAATKPDTAKPEAEPKHKKTKIVRDSFTMPHAEYQVLTDMKKLALKAGLEVKKSELLRVGVALIQKLDITKLKDILASLSPVKAGRPKNEK